MERGQKTPFKVVIMYGIDLSTAQGLRSFLESVRRVGRRRWWFQGLGKWLGKSAIETGMVDRL